MTGQAVWLLAGLFLAHYLGDFTPLATARMQHAKANGGPLHLIAGHAAIHGLLVALAVIMVVGGAWSLALTVFGLELLTHFGLDAGKARLNRRYPVLNNPQRDIFWLVLGLDQLGHALVLVGLATLVL